MFVLAQPSSIYISPDQEDEEEEEGEQEEEEAGGLFPSD